MHYIVLCPQNGDRIVTIVSVTSFHPVHSTQFAIHTRVENVRTWHIPSFALSKVKDLLAFCRQIRNIRPLCAVEYTSAHNHLQSFPVAYMNITPDREEVGFVQLFAVSTNISLVSIQVRRL